ncbi:hypothetical protein FOZ63_009095 [Perkinsus olseni]|uniref:Uncharacterized protein n=1 Tax=Perkinsus olseni TaxID=32597 RepID=A0A7J6UBX7_PEROL|nr:hypothetical protein FOZ63_009095 [Perkinsus olseni]
MVLAQVYSAEVNCHFHQKGQVSSTHSQPLRKCKRKYFKTGNYKKALFKYHLALNQLRVLRDPKGQKSEAEAMASMVSPSGEGAPAPTRPEDLADIKELKRTIHLNMANCYCKEEKFKKGVEAATRSIELQPTVKAYYRRAVAWIGRGTLVQLLFLLRHTQCNSHYIATTPVAASGDYDAAMSDLKEAASLDPTDRSVKAEMDVVERKRKAEVARQRKQLAGMFGRP